MTNWPALIGEHIQVHQQIRALDREGLWEHALPSLGASEADVARLEEKLGQLPPQFRSFLLAADGWRAFYQWVDLFSVRELLGQEREEATRLVPAALGPYRAPSFLAVAATRAEERDLGADVFFLALSGPTVGRVDWIGGAEVVDTFSDFAEFFVSMTAYERREEKRLVKEWACPAFVDTF